MPPSFYSRDIKIIMQDSIITGSNHINTTGNIGPSDTYEIVGDQSWTGNQIVTIFNIQTIPSILAVKDIIGYTFNVLAQV